VLQKVFFKEEILDGRKLYYRLYFNAFGFSRKTFTFPWETKASCRVLQCIYDLLGSICFGYCQWSDRNLLGFIKIWRTWECKWWHNCWVNYPFKYCGLIWLFILCISCEKKKKYQNNFVLVPREFHRKLKMLKSSYCI